MSRSLTPASQSVFWTVWVLATSLVVFLFGWSKKSLPSDKSPIRVGYSVPTQSNFATDSYRTSDRNRPPPALYSVPRPTGRHRSPCESWSTSRRESNFHTKKWVR